MYFSGEGNPCVIAVQLGGWRNMLFCSLFLLLNLARTQRDKSQLQTPAQINNQLQTSEVNQRTSPPPHLDQNLFRKF